jgi:hypothetical protein
LNGDVPRPIPAGALDVGRHAAFRVVFILHATDTASVPYLHHWSVDIVPPGEAALGLPGPADTTVARGPVYHFPVHVAAPIAGTVGEVSVSWTAATGLSGEFGREVIGPLASGEERAMDFPLQTALLPSNVEIAAVLWNGETGHDLVAANNACGAHLQISGGGSAVVRLIADGHTLREGDYVASAPLITLDISATTVPLENAELRVDGVPVAEEGGREETLFRPQLTEGVHVLDLRAIRRTSGYADTLFQSLKVNVERRTRLLQVYAYPSPFAGETSFVFMLTGEEAPEEARVRVFTVAGRKIRDFSVPGPMLAVGYNRIAWDGRDDAGDELANGVYFFQIAVRARGGSVETTTGKVVRVR